MRGIIAALMLVAGCDRVFSQDHDPADESLCAGGPHRGTDGLFGLCLDAPPPDMFEHRASIDTGSKGMGPADCTLVVIQTDAEEREACVIAARTIGIHADIEAHGQRPLVLFALDELVLDATLDVASRRAGTTGAGAGYVTCAGPEQHGKNDVLGGGGGAGGTLGARGGDGGIGSSSSGQSAGGVSLTVPTAGVVRGGCEGGNGGSAGSGSGVGRGGAAGGAVYLIAGRAITIGGTINASGAGGGPGMARGGGGGGGSGGMIGVDAPSIELAPGARLVANGGGGGGGGGSNLTDGSPGREPDLMMAFPYGAAAGAGSTQGGARGGAGGHATMPVGEQGVDAVAGAGGGGGGVGLVLLYGTDIVGVDVAQLSPMPAP